MRNLAAEGDLTIIALGPLTNVALALSRYPDMRDGVIRIFVMGGAGGGGGQRYLIRRVQHPCRSARRKRRTRLGHSRYAGGSGRRRCREFGPRRSGLAIPANRTARNWRPGSFAAGFQIHPDRSRYVLCDPLTVATAVAPDVFEYRQGTVVVDEEGESVGKTRATYGDGNVSIALGVDEARARGVRVGAVGQSLNAKARRRKDAGGMIH